MSTIQQWIINTNDELQNADIRQKEFNKFIQIYFLFNNIMKKGRTALSPAWMPSTASHTDIMTEFLPKLVKNHWQALKDNTQIKDEMNLLCVIMQKFVEYLLENDFFTNKGKVKNKNIVFTEILNVGYFNDSTSFRTNTLTRSDYENFTTGINYNKYSKEKTIGLIESTLKTVHAVRNNFYHGEKENFDEQQELLYFLNYSMIKLLKFTHIAVSDISGTPWNFMNELEGLENTYKAELQTKIKKKFKYLYDKEKRDIENWIDTAENNASFLKFSYFFIVTERISSIIQKSTFNTDLGLIDAVKQLELLLESPYNKISELETAFDQASSLRNDIFHGNDDINFSNSQFDAKNEILKSAINDLMQWLDEKMTD